MESCLRQLLAAVVLMGACQSRGPNSASADAAPPHSANGSGPAAPVTPIAPDASTTQPPVSSPYEPTTEMVIQRRLADKAATLPKDAIVPRIGLADLAYPRSQAELKEMGGFAAMLVTVICRDASELPVTKVELKLPNDQLTLPLAVSRMLELPSAAAPAAYGRARFDGVYLLPVFMTRREATVVAVLGAGARPLAVLSFPSDADDERLPPGLDFDWPPFQPETPAIHRLIDEELPVLSGMKLVGEN